MNVKHIKIYQSPIAPNDWQIAVVAENEHFFPYQVQQAS